MELPCRLAWLLFSITTLCIGMATTMTTSAQTTMGGSAVKTTGSGTSVGSTMASTQTTMDMSADNTTMITEDMYNETTTTTMGMNCSYPGQQCQNGTCTSAGRCSCNQDYTGVYCETYLECPNHYCLQEGSNNCTVMPNGSYSCSCKHGYSGDRCRMHNGCQSSPCQNNGTCRRLGEYGRYTCNCTTGDPINDCRLNEENDCVKEMPSSFSKLITCVDLIGSKRMYCAPGYNGSTCSISVQDTNYCQRHGCINSTYCKPLCNVNACNKTDICKNFTAVQNSTLTRLYDLTECHMKFANGFRESECEQESALFDAYDKEYMQLKDCSPFFDTVCTKKFADNDCNIECNNRDCLHDGGDCLPGSSNNTGSPPGSSNNTGSPPGFTVIKFAKARTSRRIQIQTKLSLFVRSRVDVLFSRDGLQAGVKLIGSEFSEIAVASKFIGAGIGRLPGLVDYVVDVFSCEPGKYTNGLDSCDTNCSSTCVQSGDVCNWYNGACIKGCQDNYWGGQCQHTCHANCNGTCGQRDGSCLICPAGSYGTSCEMPCDKQCNSPECQITSGRCTCKPGYYWAIKMSKCVACSKGCDGGTCNDEDGYCSCLPGYYGFRCVSMCSSHCKDGSCSMTGDCSHGCQPGYHGPLCTKSCPEGCDECKRDTGDCIGENKGKHVETPPEDNNTGVIIAILIAVVIVLLIIVIAIICWKRKQSGDYILEDEEMECPVKQAGTLEAKTNLSLQPVSPYMGRSTDMIELDEKQEKQETGIYVGPATGSKLDMADRNPDGKSTKSDESGSSSDDEKKKPEPKPDSDDDKPATGVGAPTGRKRSSLKIMLSREKPPSEEMSPKSPSILVINDKTGEVLTPLTFDIPEQSAFVMPTVTSPLRSTMAPLASEEDLLKDMGPKKPTTPEAEVPPVFADISESESIPPADGDDDEAGKNEDKKSRKSSSSSNNSKSSKRSSTSSEGKKSSSSSSGSDLDDDEKVSEYDENKEPITEM